MANAGPYIANHIPITSVETISGNTPLTGSETEAATQTFYLGTPVQLNASGQVQAWDGTTIAAGIVGVSLEDAHNIGAGSVGSPTAFGSVAYPGTGTTFGKVQNEASAVNIPRGAPFSIGALLFEVANLDTIFEAQFDDSAGSGVLAATVTTAQSQVGAQYGLTVDANGHWYIDANKTTTASNTVVIITDLNPIDGPAVNGRLRFKFLLKAQQLQAQ